MDILCKINTDDDHELNEAKIYLNAKNAYISLWEIQQIFNDKEKYTLDMIMQKIEDILVNNDIDLSLLQ